MALPIKDTPVLTGKDAERFWKRAAEVEAGMHREPKEIRERVFKNYEEIRKNSEALEESKKQKQK